MPEEPADPIISIHDGAITESLLEEEREGYVANDAMEMFEANAVLEQEAEGREQLETLKWQVKHKRNQVKMLQEQVVAASTALTNRNRLVEEMGGRLGVLTSELTDSGAFHLVQKGATLSSKARDREKMAAYEARFKQTIDYVMLRALDKSVAARTDAALGPRALDESTLPRLCVILYCPDGEPKEEARDEFAMRVTGAMSFRDLRNNAARYVGARPTDCVLEDQREAQWPLEANVLRELQRYRGSQVVRLVKREVEDADMEREEGEQFGEEEADEDEPALENLIGLLNATAEGDEGGGDDEALGAQAAADDDSDDSDDGKEREKYVEPPMNRRKLIWELISHSIFLALFLFSVQSKRNIDDAFRLFEALQIIFIDEAFGDYNEKTFMDVATFEEAWDWIGYDGGGVLAAGLFDSDIDDEGNIMMYNKLVGGIRLRQLRVGNKSCTLPSSIMKQELTAAGTKKSAFVFPETESDEGGGLCFGSYDATLAATEPYGPCTVEGREKLKGVEGVDINKYNTSCEGSGFEYWSAARTRAPTLQGKGDIIYDAGGYVRDVQASDEKVEQSLGKYTIKEEFDEAINELRQFMWLDEQTRAVTISFSIYNGNFNLYASCVFTFEFTPGGTVLPKYSFKMMSFFLWKGVNSFEKLFETTDVYFDMVVYVFILKNTVQELWNWARIKWRYGTSMPYFTNIWNVMEARAAARRSSHAPPPPPPRPALAAPAGVPALTGRLTGGAPSRRGRSSTSCRSSSRWRCVLRS